MSVQGLACKVSRVRASRSLLRRLARARESKTVGVTKKKKSLAFPAGMSTCFRERGPSVKSVRVVVAAEAL